MKVNVFNETDYDINLKYYRYFLYCKEMLIYYFVMMNI